MHRAPCMCRRGSAQGARCGRSERHVAGAAGRRAVPELVELRDLGAGRLAGGQLGLELTALLTLGVALGARRGGGLLTALVSVDHLSPPGSGCSYVLVLF